jgi:hypothetical protein
LAEHASDVQASLAALVQALLPTLERPRAGRLVILDAGAMLSLGVPARREVLRWLWQREAWPRAGMSAMHWQRLALLVQGDYPGFIRLWIAGAVVQLGPAS